MIKFVKPFRNIWGSLVWYDFSQFLYPSFQILHSWRYDGCYKIDFTRCMKQRYFQRDCTQTEFLQSPCVFCWNLKYAYCNQAFIYKVKKKRRHAANKKLNIYINIFNRKNRLHSLLCVEREELSRIQWLLASKVSLGDKRLFNVLLWATGFQDRCLSSCKDKKETGGFCLSRKYDKRPANMADVVKILKNIYCWQKVQIVLDFLCRSVAAVFI